MKRENIFMCVCVICTSAERKGPGCQISWCQAQCHKVVKRKCWAADDERPQKKERKKLFLTIVATGLALIDVATRWNGGTGEETTAESKKSNNIKIPYMWIQFYYILVVRWFFPLFCSVLLLLHFRSLLLFFYGGQSNCFWCRMWTKRFFSKREESKSIQWTLTYCELCSEMKRNKDSITKTNHENATVRPFRQIMKGLSKQIVKKSSRRHFSINKRTGYN